VLGAWRERICSGVARFAIIWTSRLELGGEWRFARARAPLKARACGEAGGEREEREEREVSWKSCIAAPAFAVVCGVLSRQDSVGRESTGFV